MLILTRRVGETIVIGDDVIVTVLGIKGNQVRIGINAPKTVTVHREEIYQRIQQEKGGPVATKEAAAPVTAAPTQPTAAPTTTAAVTIKKKREPKLEKTDKENKENKE